jgi:two-component system, LytTR family, sensor kinase
MNNAERPGMPAYLPAHPRRCRYGHTARMKAMDVAHSDHVPEQAGASRRQVWLLAFGFWTLLALSYALSSGLSALSEGHDANWLRGLAWNLSDFWLWMLLAAIIGWLGQRSAGRKWSRFLLLHLPASLGMALAQTVLQLLIFWTVSGPGKMPVTSFGGFVQMEFAYKFQQGLVIYWVILAVLRGMESRRHLRDERLRRTQLETQLAQAQLQALRMQLQPHFLFNTLNAISALALADPLQARLMIARLSDFLRLTLEERHAPQVPLARELEFLTCYLGIQQVRFQDRLSTQLDVDDDTLAAAVPNLILQPLVENALRHGLQDKPGAGILRISTRRDGAHLQLRVDDDGLGLPPAGTLEGIGLGNTRSRLRMLFGDAAGLELSAIPGGGTRVEVRLPFAEHIA